ncbi:DUF3027 domain-containing protein [Granulicoccus phenolivorans]|uniref:DUF3027 domain-containing protein n=1 Tax=Granulicoccus phenolivorans TaxID=266854 RepID=UPI000401D5D2|nr:DUF3027 domain-containing protein [Granulicoccus phenolivorans]
MTETAVATPPRARTARPKLDPTLADAVDAARAAANEAAHATMTVGEHLGCTAEADRVATHWFVCSHPGYRGWRWAVTVARAARAKKVTVTEVSLLPGEGSLVAPAWVPWTDRIGDGDLVPGSVLPTPDNDPRLEPGYTGGELAADTDPAEASQLRALVAELGLGRQRVLSREGRDEAVDRWLDGPGGPDNELTRAAPGECVDCGYFVRLGGSLGRLFGVCANRYSPSDGHVVSLGHGCGGHSDVVAPERGVEIPPPVWDTITTDDSLFD